jgi:hypothetical protein
VTSVADLRPGMIGFGPIHGGAGALVNAGQVLLGEGFHVGKLDIRHVFVVTENPGILSRGVMGVEAMPNGARACWFGADRWTPEYAYVQLPEDYPGQADDAAAVAQAMIGTPYSFASYAALAAWRFGMKTPRLEAWIDRRRDPIPFEGNGTHAQNGTNGFVALPREAICSVLADQAWALTGKQVMPAGIPHQCVTPGALAAALLETDGARWLWPR